MTSVTDNEILTRIRPVTAEEKAHYRAEGWVLLCSVLPPELIERLLEIARTRMGADAESDEFSGRGARYAAWTQASWDDEALRQASQSRELAAIASSLTGGRALRWYSDTFLAKKMAAAGGAETPWHQDLPQHAFDRVGALTMWVPLLECPPERGTLKFLSGSHRAGPLGRFGRRADGAARGADIVATYPAVADEYPASPPLHLRVGDVTVHDALTVHAAPENDTEEVRWVYAVTWFPAETLYTGASSYHTNGLGLQVDCVFDHQRFPVVTG